MRQLIVLALALASCDRKEEPARTPRLAYPGFSLALPASVVDKRSEDTFEKGFATLEREGDQVGVVTWSHTNLSSDAEKIARDKLITKTGDMKPAKIELLPSDLRGAAWKAMAGETEVYLALFECDQRLVAVQLVYSTALDAKAAIRSLVCTPRPNP